MWAHGMKLSCRVQSISLVGINAKYRLECIWDRNLPTLSQKMIRLQTAIPIERGEVFLVLIQDQNLELFIPKRTVSRSSIRNPCHENQKDFEF